ncbi:uncharacterized protein LOC128739230 [Sabethes cyaneus]|uniref:uncharacterized protein LOC128739230 n=1 Tax=Sabethes cyaneus TaxID=53552 RepID=UPI00237E1325|nr:uncharacterized protein LOC128739230 [Sabethes cyaneus]
MADLDDSGCAFTIKSEHEDGSFLIKIENTEVFDPDDLGSDSNSVDQFRSQTEKLAKKTLAEEMSNTSARQKKDSNKRTLSQIASEYILTKDKFYHCCIDERSGCRYVQRHLDINNFVRHFRTLHRQRAYKIGLIKDDSAIVAKKRRIIPRKPIAIDVQSVLEACLKLVTYHNLPLKCFEWSGFRLLLDPISEALGMRISQTDIKSHLHTAAKQVIDQIKTEMMNKLVSIKIDSVSRHGRHVLSVNVQYENNREIVMHTLSVIEVEEDPIAKNLKCKVDNVFLRYGLARDQIFIIVIDNGASIFSGEKHRQKLFSNAMFTNELVKVDNFNDSLKEEELLKDLVKELSQQYFVVRGAIHILQTALNDVVQESDSFITQITDFAISLKKAKYTDEFSRSKAIYPPSCSPSMWNGKYAIIECIVKQENFFTSLSRTFPELKLTSATWQFMKEYLAAFMPTYNVIMLMQNEHRPFSDFYMQWLVAIKDVRSLSNNRFSKPLVESLTKRLGALKENVVFKAALYLDPRFNYLNSAVFTIAEKIEIQNYIIDLFNKIGNAKPTGSSSTMVESEATNSSKDDMDDFLTEMFGGTLETSETALRNQNSPLLQIIKVLEIEPRQPHNYDVWKHWLLNQANNPELFAVAMVVLATPSNFIPIERAVSTLAVLMSDVDDGNKEQTLEDILLVRLNQGVFDRLNLTKENSDYQESSDTGT